MLAALRAERADDRAAAELRAVVEPAIAAAGRRARGAASSWRGSPSYNAGDARRRRRRPPLHAGGHPLPPQLAVADASPLLADAVERARLALSQALEALPESPAWHDRSVEQHARLLAALAPRRTRAPAAMARHVEDTARALDLMLTTLGS